MKDNTEHTIAVVGYEPEGMSRGVRDIVTERISVDKLRDKLEEFLSNLQTIVDLKGEETGPFRLEEIQFTAEMTVDGEFKLVGVGVGAETKGAISLVLRRKDAK
jgi:hypothetical protein